MPSERGIAVTQGQTPRRRGRGRKFADASLAPLSPASDPLYQRYLDGNKPLNDAELAEFCRITPASVYVLRDIIEGRVPKGAMAILEGFALAAKYGHAPAKGAAKPSDPETAKTVIFQINVAQIRPEVAASEPKLVLDVQAEPEPIEVPVVALTVKTDG